MFTVANALYKTTITTIILCSLLLAHYFALGVERLPHVMPLPQAYQDFVSCFQYEFDGGQVIHGILHSLSSHVNHHTVATTWIQSLDLSSSLTVDMRLYHCLVPLVFLLLLPLLLSFRVRRSLRAFGIATILVIHFELTKLKVKLSKSINSDLAWERSHMIAALYLRESFFSLKGIYLKLGQYISSRADLMPGPYLEELSYLQDATPPNPITRLKSKLEKSLGGRLRDIFLVVEKNVLASASIAQVHKATLKDGTPVVIKVQHPDVKLLLGIDMANLQTIFRAIAILEPDFDFSALMDEWSRAVLDELDFTLEGSHIKRACETALRSGLDVVVPKPLVISPEVIVMTYCEGFKATDEKALNASNIDRHHFVETVCNIFGYM